MKTFKQFLGEASYDIVASGKVHRNLSSASIKFVDDLIKKFKLDKSKVGIENLQTSRYTTADEIMQENGNQAFEISYDDGEWVALYKQFDTGEIEFYLNDGRPLEAMTNAQILNMIKL